jgi:hypothetical protein
MGSGGGEAEWRYLVPEGVPGRCATPTAVASAAMMPVHGYGSIAGGIGMAAVPAVAVAVAVGVAVAVAVAVAEAEAAAPDERD